MPLMIRGAEQYSIIGSWKEAGTVRGSSVSWGTVDMSKPFDEMLGGASALCFFRLASSTVHSIPFFTHLEQGRE
jgi:hypothetical protein